MTDPSLTAVREQLAQVEPHRIKELKCWPKYYFAIESGIKPFEIRKNDRNYQADDVLWLREWDPTAAEYTGREMCRRVTYVTDFGQQPGFVVMGLALVTSQAADPVPATPPILSFVLDCRDAEAYGTPAWKAYDRIHREIDRLAIAPSSAAADPVPAIKEPLTREDLLIAASVLADAAHEASEDPECAGDVPMLRGASRRFSLAYNRWASAADPVALQEEIARLQASHKQLRAEVVTVISDPHLTWGEARAKLCLAINDDASPTSEAIACPCGLGTEPWHYPRGGVCAVGMEKRVVPEKPSHDCPSLGPPRRADRAGAAGVSDEQSDARSAALPKARDRDDPTVY